MTLLQMAGNIVKTMGGFVVLALGALYIFQNNLLYHPNPPGIPKTCAENPRGFRSPDEWNKDGSRNNSKSVGKFEKIPFEENFITTEDGFKIHTWLLLQDNSENTPTLIYFHGNAGNMGLRLKNAALMYGISKINILMMDYRGFGSSQGVPTENGIVLDARAVVKYLKSHPKLTNSPLIAFGRSLGGAVSIALAQHHPKDIDGIILENTFLSISDMVDSLLPWVSYFKFLVLRISWNNANTIPTIKQPVMFISGANDELVPPFHMKKLFDLATSSSYKDFFLVPGGTHNNTFEVAGIQYYHRLKAFVDKLREKCPNELASDDELETLPDASDYVAIPTMTKSFTVR